MPPLIPVEVSYTVERTVYVYADSQPEAKRLARDITNWADADDPHEMMDTLRVKKAQFR